MSEEDYDLIEKNLAGTATTSEQDLLSRKLNEPSFRKDYEEFSEVQKAIRVSERLRLKALLANEEVGAAKTRSFSMWPWALAASVSAILIISYFMLKKDLVEEYYLTYNDLTIAKPRGDNESYLFKNDAYIAYKNNKGEVAIQLSDSVLRDAPDDEEALFIRGLAHLQLKQYNEAAGDLVKVKDDAEARWFLALAYLGNGEKEKAIKLLSEISNDSHSSFKDRAVELLERLK